MVRTAELREFDLRKQELRHRLTRVGTYTCRLTDESGRKVMMKLTDRTFGSARLRGRRRQLPGRSFFVAVCLRLCRNSR